LQVALESFAREANVPLSTVALAGLMQKLFAEDLAAWREAERAGRSLGEHLAARPAAAATSEAERTATDAFGSTRRRAPRRPVWVRALALTAFAAVFALAGGLAAKKWRADAERAPAANAIPRVSSPASPGTATTTPAEIKTTGGAKIVAAAVVPGAPPSTTRVRRVKRAPVEAPPATPPVSRLHGWDPDSPRPP
jgi:hypothetical protein